MPDGPVELNPRRTPLYRFARWLVGGVGRILFRPTIVGRENIPATGPVLIAPTHRSNVDFAFTIYMTRRKVFFMAKHGLFTVPVFGTVLRHLGAFPVDRDATDRASMRLAEEVLARGEALVLYPEGTRKFGMTFEPLHDGAMFVAARARAPVVPVAVGGSEAAMPHGAKMVRPSKVRIVIGAPIDPPEFEGRVPRSAVAAKSEELRAALEALYARAMGA